MSNATPVTEPGMFALVLHSHLPWLANHGRWPVGEEWIYQSWAASYIPLAAALRRLADEGRSHLLTLGITPVLAAQLDDPHCLAGMHHWLGNWQIRAHEAAGMPDAAHRELGAREHRASAAALADFETHWQHGASPVFRDLIDREAFELLGGPLAHPFQPLLDPRLRAFSLREGLADAHCPVESHSDRDLGTRVRVHPGHGARVRRSGRHPLQWSTAPALRGDTSLGRPVRESDVVAFGRDLQVSYRVWSPKSGYPGHAAYRDFHTYDHETGLKPSRVTGRTVDSADKLPYDPEVAAAAVDKHVADFVETVRARLRSESTRIGRDCPGGRSFRHRTVRALVARGSAVARKTPARASRGRNSRRQPLADAKASGYVGEPVQLEDSSWGSGKDWRVWAGDQVSDLVQLNSEVVDTALTTVDKSRGRDNAPGRPELRNRVNDQVLRETLMTVSSDWAFMVSKDSAAGYARERAHKHAHATREISEALVSGRDAVAERLAEGWNRADGLFPGLDARRLPDTELSPS